MTTHEMASPTTAYRSASSTRRSRTPGLQEWAAIFLLLFGGFFGIGWVAGLILLWASSAWRTRDKWIATLILPGGLAGSVFLAFVSLATLGSGSCVQIGDRPERCTGGPSQATEIVTLAGVTLAVLAPIIVAVYLAHRAKRGGPVSR